MESYDVFLIGNFVALPAFRKQYGIFDAATHEYVIVTKWQSALQVSGQLGALIGVFLAGPLTSRIGYRWATLTGLMLLNVFIFAFYFASSLPVIFVAQLLEGLPWGIFIANAPAYCSEIVPIKLRAPATQMLQMFWAIGSIIVGAVTYRYNGVNGPSAYKYVLIRFQKSSSLTKRNQDSYCATVDVPHPACDPHLLCTRVALVAGSKGTSPRSSTFGRAPRTQVEAES
jgi:SP family general alpha glucoside:H+ symporter-like MFS transporter